ncbi:MAG TPA: 4Fe-4S binding protein [Bryobacteraceae bacterium]|nr:4Fe-4S binding protein [Bryobacteraceae bacterium]
MRRLARDHSQRIRQAVQIAFFLLNVWIGIQFYFFVRYYETNGATCPASRPSGIDGWLPIASLMNLKYLLQTGEIPRIHAAGMFLLLAFLLISVAMRKSFCSWLCPVGTLSEWLWKLGRETFRRNWTFPRWLDLPLRGIKYLLLALFLYAVGSMSSDAIRAFLEGPYGVVADVKLLNFFRYLSLTAAVTLGVLLIGSLFVRNLWCRYLCPYGALLGLFALASPVRIRRNPAACIDCAKCAQACPSTLPVDTLVQIRSAECTVCMTCVSVCPAEDALDLRAGRRRLSPAMVAGVIGMIFFSLYGYAELSGHWDAKLPQGLYLELIPRASEFAHP